MAGIHNLPQIRRQTTARVELFRYTDKNKDPIDISSGEFFVQFRKDCDTGAVVREMELGSGISFKTDGTDGWLQFDSFLLEWQEGRYFYDIKSIISGLQQIAVKGTRIVIENTSKNS